MSFEDLRVSADLSTVRSAWATRQQSYSVEDLKHNWRQGWCLSIVIDRVAPSGESFRIGGAGFEHQVGEIELARPEGANLESENPCREQVIGARQHACTHSTIYVAASRILL